MATQRKLRRSETSPPAIETIVSFVRVFTAVLLTISILFLSLALVVRGTRHDDLELLDPTESVEYRRSNEECEPYVGKAFEPAPEEFPRLTATLVLEGLNQPTTVDFLDEENAFIGQREGGVLQWHLPSGTVRPILLGLVSDTSTVLDQGLLGITVDPAAEYLYVHRTKGNGDNEVIAYPIIDDIPQEPMGTVVLQVGQLNQMHNGGSIDFGPDGSFWITVGDGGLLGNPFKTGQDPTSLLGGIGRFVVSEDGPELLPHPDNPFYGSDAGDDRLFAYGLRNPFRFSVDAATGDVWLGDVGQQCVEEIDVLRPEDGGANLGWNVYEGTRLFLEKSGKLSEHEDEYQYHEPAFTYEYGSGYCAVIGGLVYRGDKLPSLNGQYLFGDLCRGRVLALARDRQSAWDTTALVKNIVALHTSPDGRLFAISILGSIYEILEAN